MEIKCDKCGALVNEVRSEQIRNGDIEHTYFRCPECGAVYPVATTDAALRKDIAVQPDAADDPHKAGDGEVHLERGGTETKEPETDKGADGAISISSFAFGINAHDGQKGGIIWQAVTSRAFLWRFRAIPQN